MSSLSLIGQNNPVQFSGRIVIEHNGRISPVPFANIAVKNTPRGTSSSHDGFFSLVVLPGETILFSRLGFSLEHYVVPLDLEDDVHSKIIVMQEDTLFLPEISIVPLLSQDFFKIEFLALDLDTDLETIASENLTPQKLATLREVLPSDGREVAALELQQIAQSYYYEGQIKPQNIFNPLSWKKFIDAIKRGDYKKKPKPVSE